MKEFDHALDASRYAFFSGDAWLSPVPAGDAERAATDPFATFLRNGDGSSLSWMSRI